MRPKVYIETSVISYLVARRNQRDLLVAANQELTREWWDSRGHDLPLAEVTEPAVALAESLLRQAGIPQELMEEDEHA